MATTKSPALDVEYRGTFSGNSMTDLDDNRLLAVSEGPSGSISEDAGRTWSSSFRFMQSTPASTWDGSTRPMNASPMKDAVIKLSNGYLGMVYNRTDPEDPNIRTWYFASSQDEGKTWGSESQIDIPAKHDMDRGVFDAVVWGNFIQLSSGRLIVAGYWGMSGRNPGLPPFGPDPVKGVIQGKEKTRLADGHTYEAGLGGCFTYYSDDLGRTWSRSVGNVVIWPLDSEDNMGGFASCFEPVLMELKDGRVLMFVRTTRGRMHQSFSEDQGTHWSLAEPTELSSGDVPSWLGRLRTTGDLLAVWNQSSDAEIDVGYSRGRLSSAISRDEGKTWGDFHTVALSGGMADVARVEPTSIKHQRARPDLGVLPDDFSRNYYPKIAFSQGKVIITYGHTIYVDGEPVKDTGMVIVPEGRLYD